MTTSNFTMVPNVFFDEMMKEMSDSELRVFLTTIRHTIGWHKKSDPISTSQYMEETGMTKPGVQSGVETAISKGTIGLVGTGSRGVKIYSPVIRQPQFNVESFLEIKASTGKAGLQVAQLTGKAGLHTKESNAKENKISAPRTRDRSYMGLDVNRPAPQVDPFNPDAIINSELVKFVVTQIGKTTLVPKNLQADLSSKTKVPEGNHTIVYNSAIDMFDTDPMFKEFVIERIKSFKSLLHPPKPNDVLKNICNIGKPPVSELGVKQWPGYHFWKKDRYAEPGLANVKKTIDYGAPPDDEVQDDTD